LRIENQPTKKEFTMKAILYFLYGAVAGAIIALLLAPQSGEELRAKIRSTADEDWQRIQLEWQAGMEKTQARLDQVTSDLKQVMQKQTEAEAESGTTD